MDNKYYLSIVLPIYNEEKNIPELYGRLKNSLKIINKPFELIFVNDGSKDRSPQLVYELSKKDPCVKLIDLSRNFGHQVAITAGIDFAEGSAVVIIDSDLQDPPEVIPELVKKWREGYEVVYAKRINRKDTLFKKSTAYLFYRIFKKLSPIEMPTDVGDFRLIDRKVVLEVRKLREKSRFMRGLISWVGFKQGEVLFERDERRFGKTNYPLKKMIKFAIDGITSFSYLPLRLTTYLGFVTASLGFALGIYALFIKFIKPEQVVPGWATVIIVMTFLGGIQLLIIGIIGEYIGRIYTESQARPLYVVRSLKGFEKSSENYESQSMSHMSES